MGSKVQTVETEGRELYKQFKPFRVNVPMGHSGKWSTSIMVSQVDLEYLRLWRDGRSPGVGSFTRLSCEGRGVIMSDTVPEITDLLHDIWNLQGRVLVSGLGLGMVVHILTKIPRFSDNVKSITVIEKELDVIKLVGQHYLDSDPRVTILLGDTNTYSMPSGTEFDSAWHDIWDSMCGDNLEQMKQLRKHHKPWVSTRKQFCWSEKFLKAEKRRYG